MDSIKCPHCNFEHRNWQDYGLDGGDMEGAFSMDCEKCRKNFNVKFKMTIEFSTTIEK